MVKAWLGQGHAGVQFEVDHVNNCQRHLADDRRPTGRADREYGLAVLHYDRGAHAGERAFAGRNRVRLRAHQTKVVRRPRLCGEVVHLVVQNDSGARHDNFGTK